MEIYGICPACKAVMSFPDDGNLYSCIACEKKPALLRTTELFKVCGMVEGLPRVKTMELLVALQDTISKEMDKEEEGEKDAGV